MNSAVWRNLMLFVITITLITMCNRMPKKDTAPRAVKEYSIIYPNGDTVLMR